MVFVLVFRRDYDSDIISNTAASLDIEAKAAVELQDHTVKLSASNSMLQCVLAAFSKIY